MTIQSAGTGSVVVSPQKSSYAHGEVVTLTAVNGTKPFDRWTGDASGSTTPLTIIMDGDKSITATFADPP